MTRLFTALEIPEDIALKLSMFQGGIPGARWIEKENYHVTLRFLGEVDLQTQQAISDQLHLLQAEPLTISIKGLGAFGKKRPRSIFAAIEPNLPLSHLQQQMERTVQILGLEPEHRKFTPHITLARLSNAHPRGVELFCAQNNLRVREDFTASSLALYSAKGSTGGGPYVVEERFEFAS